MRITDEGMRRVLNRYIEQQSEVARMKDARNKESRAKGMDEETPSDKVTLSERALELQYALKELNGVADAHREKVESIRKDLESGVYKVTGGAMVAKKLLES